MLRSLIAFLAGFGCVQAWAILDAAEPSEAGSPQYAATDVVAPPPSQLVGWSYALGGTTVSRDRWDELAEHAVGVRGRVNDGDYTWVATVVALESDFFEVEDRLACAAHYATSIESHCSVRFDLGILRESATDGRVVYSRGTPFMDDESAAERSACEVFLKCMVHSKLGGIVPLPPDDGSEFVVYQLVGLMPMTDDLLVPENLRVGVEMSGDYQRELERRIRDGETPATAFLQAQMLSLSIKARYYGQRAAELEAQAAR